MNRKEMARLMPELNRDDIEQLMKEGLEGEFILHHLTKKDALFPKDDKAYLVKSGDAFVHAYTDDGLEFHIRLQKDEGIGMLNIFIEEELDFILRGMDRCSVLEIPIKKALQTTNIKFILSLYEKMLSAMSINLFKMLKNYAAKVNYTNEQYLLNFIVTRGGSYRFSSSEDLAHLLHIDLRTLQRIIRKLSDRGVLIKKKNIIELLDCDTQKKQ